MVYCSSCCICLQARGPSRRHPLNPTPCGFLAKACLLRGSGGERCALKQSSGHEGSSASVGQVSEAPVRLRRAVSSGSFRSVAEKLRKCKVFARNWPPSFRRKRFTYVRFSPRIGIPIFIDKVYMCKVLAIRVPRIRQSPGSGRAPSQNDKLFTYRFLYILLFPLIVAGSVVLWHCSFQPLCTQPVLEATPGSATMVSARF